MASQHCTLTIIILIPIPFTAAHNVRVSPSPFCICFLSPTSTDPCLWWELTCTDYNTVYPLINLSLLSVAVSTQHVGPTVAAPCYLCAFHLEGALSSWSNSLNYVNKTQMPTPLMQYPPHSSIPSIPCVKTSRVRTFPCY